MTRKLEAELRRNESVRMQPGVTPGAMPTQNFALGCKRTLANGSLKNALIRNGTPSSNRSSAVLQNQGCRVSPPRFSPLIVNRSFGRDFHAKLAKPSKCYLDLLL